MRPGLRTLKERARAVHADLLNGCTFVHGEGTAPTRLRATAIKFRETAVTNEASR